MLKRAFMFIEDGDWNSADEYCEKVLDIDPENAQAYLGKLLSELQVRKEELLKNQTNPFDDRNNYQKAIRFGDTKLKNKLNDCIEHINTRNEEKRINGIYQKARHAMLVANTEETYKKVAQLFETMLEYRDSALLAKECYKKANKIKEDKEKCDELFKNLKFTVENARNGKNPKNQAEKIITEQTKRFQELLIIQSKWNEVEANITSYNNEIQILQVTNANLNEEKGDLGFLAVKRKKEISLKIKSNEEKIRILKDKIVAEEERKGGFLSLESLEKEIRQTKEKIDVQNKIIADISSVDDSRKIRDELSSYVYGEQLLSNSNMYFDDLIKIGTTIKFGLYPQEKEREKKSIEWIVLDKKDGRALIISKHALDCKPYNVMYDDVSWQNCSLRKWLNNEFYNSAFSNDEKSIISKLTVSVTEHGLNQGKTVQDRVFLLSVDEVRTYLHDVRWCKPTSYAVSKGVHLDRKKCNCRWWLRTRGISTHTAACFSSDVTGDYYICEVGEIVHYDNGVRPALWINLDI